MKTSHKDVTGPRRDPLTRPASAGECAAAGHPFPQGGEGYVFTQALKRGPSGPIEKPG